MEDRGTAISPDEDMMESTMEIEAWFAGHGGERSGWSCNKSMRMPTPKFR